MNHFFRHVSKKIGRDCSLHTRSPMQRKPLSWTFCSARLNSHFFNIVYYFITSRICRKFVPVPVFSCVGSIVQEHLWQTTKALAVLVGCSVLGWWLGVALCSPHDSNTSFQNSHSSNQLGKLSWSPWIQVMTGGIHPSWRNGIFFSAQKKAD